MIATSPGPNSASVPSSIRMRWRPETKILTCRRWQLSPPTVGLTCDDHRQPGSRVSRAKVKPPIVTESIVAFSGVLVSSGESKLFPSSRGISISSRLRSAVLRVVAGAVPVDDHNGLVSDDPGVVTARQRGDLAGAGDELGAVVHADRELAADVVLEVRRLAAVRSGDRLDVVGPAPAGLEGVPADLAVADVEDLGAAAPELARLVGLPESLVLGLLPCACGCHLGLLCCLTRSSPASVEPSSSLPSIPRQTTRAGREPGYALPGAGSPAWTAGGRGRRRADRSAAGKAAQPVRLAGDSSRPSPAPRAGGALVARGARLERARQPS